MASSSRRKSDSSARSTGRRKVVLTAQDTSRVRNGQPKPKVDKRRLSEPLSRGSSSVAAKKVADSKRTDRERRLRSQRRMLRLRLALILVLLFSAVFGIVSVYQSQVFEVSAVDIIGNSRLSAAEVEAIAAIPDGATLLRFPADEMVQRLVENPWIESATVTRDFPDTARIHIAERVPFAQVDLGGAAFWLVSRSGVMIAQQTPETTSTLIVIRDIAGLDPRQGVKTVSEPLLNSLDVWAGLSEELQSLTRALSAPSIDKTALITHDDVEIFIGSADDIDKKDAVARGILGEQQGNVVSINVRTVDRPTWRGIGEE